MGLFKRKNAKPPSPLKGRKFPAEVLTRPEMDALLAAIGGGRPIAARNRALVIILWRTGLRIAEALALKPHDIDMAARTVRVLHGKGDKARTVALDARTRSIIEDWLKVRDRWAKPGSPLFCTSKGTPVRATYVRPMLQRAAARAGIERRVHPHMFRHAYAVELMLEGVPVPMIQRLLGHSSLAVTQTYLESLSPEAALDAVRNRQW